MGSFVRSKDLWMTRCRACQSHASARVSAYKPAMSTRMRLIPLLLQSPSAQAQGRSMRFGKKLTLAPRGTPYLPMPGHHCDVQAWQASFSRQQNACLCLLCVCDWTVAVHSRKYELGFQGCSRVKSFNRMLCYARCRCTQARRLGERTYSQNYGWPREHFVPLLWRGQCQRLKRYVPA